MQNSKVKTSSYAKASEDKQIYNPSQIESHWQKLWEEDRIYSPDLDRAKRPFYNLMMFPYPSAEGMHVGNMYAFTGADVYGRFQRMQGKDVFEPIGLDGFGIHSENYAIKVGNHPVEQSKISEKNYYKQLRAIGGSFDWTRTVETYKPEYYKWTQWIFIQLFKAGLAYRKKAPVNFCPSCKTVLADEQVVEKSKIKNQKSKITEERIGVCERCETEIEKRELEQWFFKITKYADRLLDNLSKIDWVEKVKIAQRQWIGRSEGSLIDFPLEFEKKDTSKPNYLILHGYTGRADKNFIPWLKRELENSGFKVQTPQLPNTNNPKESEQVSFVIENCQINERTIIVGHSLGGTVAMKVLEQINHPVSGLVLVAPAVEPSFRTGQERPFWNTFTWNFDYEKLKLLTNFRVVISDTLEKETRGSYLKYLSDKLNGQLIEGIAQKKHLTGEKEPLILKALLPRIQVFTTRPDTLFGATFLVLSPEHPLAVSLLKGEIEAPRSLLAKLKGYIEEAKKKTEQERSAEGKEKTGVFSGLYAINPVNNEKIPIWIADYVLMGYGTGAIMAVPAHDQRDYEFAKKYKLPIKTVILSEAKDLDSSAVPQNDNMKEAYVGEGKIINSAGWNGWQTPDSIGKVIKWLENKGLGQKEANYHLRDWLISRQRYWGPPIPLVFCENCAQRTNDEGLMIKDEFSKGEMENPGWIAVEEKNLPVELPFIEDYKPLGTGAAPLASHPEFYKTTCPNCGKPAKRETDVSDTFLDSAWYFLRYVSTDIDGTAFDTERVKKWLPVNMYIGGAEHSVLHLLYSRFITMALHDLGFFSFEEPFTKFRAHGLIIKDGVKMSKSKGNVVIPDAYVKKYGADTLRAYLMFMGPYSQGGDFRDSGIEGMSRFLRRIWLLVSSRLSLASDQSPKTKDQLRMMHKTIKKVTEDVSNLSYNTSIASLMEYYNFLSNQKEVSKEEIETFLKLLAPFAPHMTEELWERIKNQESRIKNKNHNSQFIIHNSIHVQKWPKFNEKFLVENEVIIAVQVNGKLRETLKAKSDPLRSEASKRKAKDYIEQLARQSAKVQKYLEDKKILKVIYVEGKVINFVVS